MKKSFYVTSFLYLNFLLSTTGLFACPIEANQSQSHLATELNQVRESSSVTEIEFDRLVEIASESYAGIFKKQGLKLKIDASWKDNTPNAYSDQLGETRYIYLFGGYARLPLMNKDTYLSVICHELGHHLGGFPRVVGSTWASAEGEADYFSTLKCMKNLLKDDPENERIALSLDLPEEVKNQCQIQHPHINDYYICLRSSKAAEIYGRINASLATPNSTTEISLLTPVTRRVFSTNLSYPMPQCRVDTKLQGALCNASIDIPMGYQDENKGACSVKNGNPIGARPECWFARKY